MAVPYFKRSVSKKEYEYHFKHKVQKPILNLLKRDFGIDKKIPNWVTDNPAWLIKQKRKEILKSLYYIATCIGRSKYYPLNEEEKGIKISYQDKAIRECYALHDNIQFCSEIFFPIKNINNYTQLVTAIKDEVTYLKYWKKYTDRLECNPSNNTKE